MLFNFIFSSPDHRTPSNYLHIFLTRSRLNNVLLEICDDSAMCFSIAELLVIFFRFEFLRREHITFCFRFVSRSLSRGELIINEEVEGLQRYV